MDQEISKEAAPPQDIGTNTEVETAQISDIQKSQKKTGVILMLSLAAVLIVAAAAYSIWRLQSPDGYWDYTVQMKQYAVEYSERYDYDEVITVEYPSLEGLDREVEEKLNTQLYDAAMDRNNYWHFFPDEDVKAFQEEWFSIYCSDVGCDVTFHSQSLLSVDFYEMYTTRNPIWEVKYTERTVNANLITGEIYELGDILVIDDDFITLWYSVLCELTEEKFSSEDKDIFLGWFLADDPELEPYYVMRSWFCVEEDGEFVIGLSMDPKVPAGISGNTAMEDCTYYVELTAEDLEAYRREDSSFWELYDDSQTAGEVLECADKKENLWFGESGSVWKYWEDVQ